MVSNGFMSKELVENMPNFIDAINIDIKSFQNSYYKKTLKGDLHVEITTLVIPDINDRIAAQYLFKRLAKIRCSVEIESEFRYKKPLKYLLMRLQLDLEMMYICQET